MKGLKRKQQPLISLLRQTAMSDTFHLIFFLHNMILDALNIVITLDET